MKLYDIVQALQGLMDEGEGEWTQQLEALQLSFEAKLHQCAKARLSLEAQSVAISTEIVRLSERKRSIDSRVESLSGYMRLCMLDAGQSKVSTGIATIWLQNPPPRVVVDDMELLPKQFLRYPSPEPAKANIKKSIEAGEEVPGARLESGPLSVRIR